eukprot:11180432-Lingulodinium_polyedra.AAC.1
MSARGKPGWNNKQFKTRLRRSGCADQTIRQSDNKLIGAGLRRSDTKAINLLERGCADQMIAL